MKHFQNEWVKLLQFINQVQTTDWKTIDQRVLNNRMSYETTDSQYSLCDTNLYVFIGKLNTKRATM